MSHIQSEYKSNPIRQRQPEEVVLAQTTHTKMMRNQQQLNHAGLGSLRMVFGFLFLLVIWHQCRAQVDFGRYECPRPEKLRCQYGIYTEREQDGCDTYHCKRVYGQECVHSEQCAAGLDCRCDNKCKEIGTICSEIVKQRLEEHKRFPSRFPSWFPRIRWQKLSQKYVEPEYKD